MELIKTIKQHAKDGIISIHPDWNVGSSFSKVEFVVVNVELIVENVAFLVVKDTSVASVFWLAEFVAHTL